MQILVIDFITLDGVIQAPGGPEEDTGNGFAHGGWSAPFFDPETMGPVIDDAMQRSDALLYGRRTWQGMAAAWPGRAGDPFADAMNGATKYVASRTLTEADVASWENSQLLAADDAIGQIRALRERDGGYLQVWGSASLAAQLIAEDLVDEYRLIIEPIVVGGGKRLFPEDGVARTLTLTGTVIAKTGVIVATYRRAAADSTAT